MRNNKADSGNGIVSLSYLQMLSIGIKNVSAFDFLEPPPSESVDSAIRQLALIGAVSAEAKPDQQVNGAASKYVFINLCVKSNSPYRTHINNLKNLKLPGAFETFFNFEPPVSSNGNLFTWYFEGCRKWTGQVRLCKTEFSYFYRTEVKFVLTAQGKKMSAFPLDPKFTKAILVAKDLGCTWETIFETVVFYPIKCSSWFYWMNGEIANW